MTCKDCIHYEVCKQKYYHLYESYSISDAENIESVCKSFKNKSKYIELPCEVGDTMYVLNRENRPQKMILDAPDIRCHCSDEDNLCMVLCGDKKHNICAYRLMNDGSDIGKTVFLTKSEAEQKLKELQND
jgi:hypothetical protein|nr:MAG TPA: hypothetical protein [Caudoviricetes sp.]